MGSWPTVGLLSVCELVNSRVGTFPGTRKYVSTGDTDGNEILSGQPVTFNNRPTRADIAAEEGDVLFARMQATDKVLSIKSGMKSNIWSTGFACLRPKHLINSKWLVYWLGSSAFQMMKDIRCTGATQKAINNNAIAELSIPLPPLAEQDRMIQILDEVDQLRRQGREATQLTAKIVPALFLMMFGAPSINPFGWPKEFVGNLFIDQHSGAKCGPFGSMLKKQEYTERGIPVWGIPNVLPNRFVETGSLFISESKFNELRAYAVEAGDLLISRAGTVGRICVARPKAKDSIIGTNLIRLKLDQKRVLPEFLSNLMTNFASEFEGLRADTSSGSYSFMNTSVLKTLQIYLPPLDLQKDFSQTFSGIQALQVVQSSSRSRLDDLFQSLRHRAFQGEL